MKNKCKRPECTSERMKKPGNNTLYFKYCQEHQIEYVVGVLNDQSIKYRQGLEIMRKNGSNKATSEKTRALKLADSWFSKYVRLNNSFELNGVQQAKCFTCDNIYPIVRLDCGHFQKRQYMATRFHLDNCRPQCTSCNDWKKGQYEIFEERLINEIGKYDVEILKELAKSTFHCSVESLKDTSRIYKVQFNELLKQRNIKNPWR